MNNNKKTDFSKALQELKEQTGFDFMKLLLGEEHEKSRWEQKMAEDKERVNVSESLEDRLRIANEKVDSILPEIWEQAEENHALQWFSKQPMKRMGEIVQKAMKEKGITHEDIDQWLQDYKDGKW